MAFLARMLLKQILADKSVKERLVKELRAAAQKTDQTKIDDYAVDVFSATWDIVVPVIIGKM